jgi:hypothetical protein
VIARLQVIVAESVWCHHCHTVAHAAWHVMWALTHDIGTRSTYLGTLRAVLTHSPRWLAVFGCVWLGLAGCPGGLEWLFFGCRHEARDFIYREQLEDAVANGGE